jgi:hypothetical protein
MNKSEDHVELVVGFEYCKIDGQLFRAAVDRPLVASRLAELIVCGK